MTMTDERPADDELDDELVALALAADPAVGLEPGAVAWGQADPGDGPLPDWYMPTARATRRDWKTRTAAAVIIAAFLVINGSGSAAPTACSSRPEPSALHRGRARGPT